MQTKLTHTCTPRLDMFIDRKLSCIGKEDNKIERVYLKQKNVKAVSLLHFPIDSLFNENYEYKEKRSQHYFI